MINFRRNAYDQFFVFMLMGYLVLMFFSCHSRKAASIPAYGQGTAVSPIRDESDLRGKYASQLNVSPEELLNMRIYSFIEEWMGTPYLIGGMSHLGIDCSAFSQTLYAQVFQSHIPRTSWEQGDRIIRKQRSELVEGDLVFFSSTHSKIDHVGVYLGNGHFVHASTSKGVTISDLDQDYYRRNYVCGGSFPR